MWKNTQHSYGWLSITLHWVSALCVIALFAVGFWMVDLNYYSEWYRTAPHYHKSVGLLFAALTLLRLIWVTLNPRPVSEGKPVERRLAAVAHKIMYLLLFTLFLSGYLISTADGRGIEVFDWFTVPALGAFIENQEDVAGWVHEWLAYTLISLAVLHALAALKHHFFDKDKTLRKMLKPIEEQS